MHKWPARRNKLVGVTDYIQSQFPYTRPTGYTNGRGHGKGADMGRRFGCKFDSMITRVVNSKPGHKKASIAREKPYMQRQVQFYLRFLQRMGLSPCRAQVYVQSPEHGVHTWIDLVCVPRATAAGAPKTTTRKGAAQRSAALKTAAQRPKTSAGGIVIIENKTSQLKAADYMRVYRVPCEQLPVLSNGLPNTEYTRHQLQLGFAMLQVSKLDLRHAPRGLVIIHCKDRLVRIPAAPWVLSPHMYPILSCTVNQ